MKQRLYKEGDRVEIGEFGPLSAMREYEGKHGIVSSCLNKKCMGHWIYDVTLDEGETRPFIEPFLLNKVVDYE